jgi:hypothetical protein
MLAAAFVLVTQLLMVTGIIRSAQGLSGPPPPILVERHFNFDTARGFEKVGYLDPDWGHTPVFVLRRGATGTINITVTSSESNKTVVADFVFGGYPPFNHGWVVENYIPDGVTYSFEPSNITVAPKSNGSVIMRMSAAPGTAIRGYNLSLGFLPDYSPTENRSEGWGAAIILQIIESTPPHTTSTVKIPTSYSTQTSTYTRTVTATVTTSTDLVDESSAYIWAIGTTAVAAVFAITLLRRRR